MESGSNRDITLEHGNSADGIRRMRKLNDRGFVSQQAFLYPEEVPRDASLS